MTDPAALRKHLEECVLDADVRRSSVLNGVSLSYDDARYLIALLQREEEKTGNGTA